MDSRYGRIMSSFADYEDSKKKTDVYPTLLQAVMEGDGGVFDHLARDEIHTPLTKAIVLGLHEIVKEMISKGANPNRKDGLGYLPVYLAADYSTTKVLQVLLDGGANPNDFGCFNETPIYRAITKKDISYVKILLEAKADPRISVNKDHPSAHDKLTAYVRDGACDSARFKQMLALME